MNFLEVQRGFGDRTIYQANLSTLLDALDAVNGQPPTTDPRLSSWHKTIIALIDDRQKDERHQSSSRQADDHHSQIKTRLEQVEGNTSQTATELIEARKQMAQLEGKVSEVKATLEQTHRIHLGILIVSVLALIAAAIAAADVIVKWFPRNPSSLVSESAQPTQAHSTNK